MSLQEVSTPRLKMRQWRISDASRALQIFGDCEVQNQLRSDEHVVDTEIQMVLEIRHILARGPNTMDRGEFAVVERTTGGAIGGVSWSSIESPTASGLHCIEITWMIARDHWGAGFGSEAVLFAMRNLILSATKEIEVIAVCKPCNHRAVAIAHRMGFRLLGVTATSTNLQVAVFQTVIYPVAHRRAA